jgi:hypothetical protein
VKFFTPFRACHGLYRGVFLFWKGKYHSEKEEPSPGNFLLSWRALLGFSTSPGKSPRPEKPRREKFLRALNLQGLAFLFRTKASVHFRNKMLLQDYSFLEEI